MSSPARGHVFIATSLDGFIAREDGSIDWLLPMQSRFPAGDDGGYAEFFAHVDGMVMGRATFETALAFPQWPYGDKPVVVLSRRGVAVPDALRATVQTSAEAPAALLARLGTQGWRRAYVDGGEVVRACLSDGLIDEITLTVVPVLIGRGRPLWGDSALPRDLPLELLAMRQWAFGAVQTRWRVHAEAA
jgi:dihydrofolate reductase